MLGAALRAFEQGGSPLTTYEGVWRIYSNPDSHGDTAARTFSGGCYYYRSQGCEFRPMIRLLAVRVFNVPTPTVTLNLGLYSPKHKIAKLTMCQR
jgi:hypothetical protein